MQVCEGSRLPPTATTMKWLRTSLPQKEKERVKARARRAKAKIRKEKEHQHVMLHQALSEIAANAESLGTGQQIAGQEEKAEEETEKEKIRKPPKA